jgi:hypothetical protein
MIFGIKYLKLKKFWKNIWETKSVMIPFWMNSNRVNQLQSGSWTPTELTDSNLDEPQT